MTQELLAVNVAALPVTVLMPVRNAGRYLAQALRSILAQTGVDFEIVIVDDGSVDDSPVILADFAAGHVGLRVVRGGEPGGISRSLNQGFVIARGRYVARMDADDVALPGRLAAQFKYLEEHPEIGVLGSQAWAMDEKGARGRRVRVPVGAQRVREALEVSSPLIHPTVMMRRDLVLSAGGYRPMFDAAEDYDLWLRLAAVTEFDNLDTPFLLYRRHGGQQTLRRSFRQARLSALAQVLYRLRLSGTPDPLKEAESLKAWPSALRGVDPESVDTVRLFMACALADNGGSLSAAGTLCLRRACRFAARHGSNHVCSRLALACVRHQLQLARTGRWREALACAAGDSARWRWQLMKAYIRHAGILWCCRKKDSSQ